MGCPCIGQHCLLQGAQAPRQPHGSCVRRVRNQGECSRLLRKAARIHPQLKLRKGLHCVGASWELNVKAGLQNVAAELVAQADALAFVALLSCHRAHMLHILYESSTNPACKYSIAPFLCSSFPKTLSIKSRNCGPHWQRVESNTSPSKHSE